MRFQDLPRSSQTLVFIDAAAAAVASACASPLWESVPWHQMLLAALISVALFHIHVRPAVGRGEISFGFVAILGAAMLWGPANGALVGFVAGALSTFGPDFLPRLRGRKAPDLAGVRALYNGCTGCLASAAAGFVFHAGTHAPASGAGRMWLFGMAAALAYFAVSTWLTAAILATTRESDTLRFWCTHMLPTLPQHAIGGVGAILFLLLSQAGHSLAAALLALGPVYLLHGVYLRGAEALEQRRRQIAQLRGANAPVVASLSGMAGRNAPRSQRALHRADGHGRMECARSTTPALWAGGAGRASDRRLSLVLQRSTDAQEMVEALALEAADMAPGTTAVVALVQGDTLRISAARGLYGERLRGLSVKRAGSTWEQALKQGEALLNLAPDADVLAAIPTEQPPGLRSTLVVPLMHEAKPLGVVCVYHTRRNAYGEQHAERLGLVAEIIAESLAAAVRGSAGRRSSAADALGDLSDVGSIAHRLASQIEHARASRAPFAVVLVEVDQAAAHQATGAGEGESTLGEDAPCQAERVILSCVRPSDFTARIAGNRYLVLLNDTSLESCVRVCARIATALDRAAESGGLTGMASVGYAICPDDGDTARDLLEAAGRRITRDRATRKPLSE